MADDRIWYRQDTAELAEEWLLEDLSAGSRWAWMCLKAYIKVERPSQKRHSRAERLGYRAAARRWNVTADEVEAMERAAVKSEKLKIEGEEWVLTDIKVCAHEDTARRSESKQPQISANEHEDADSLSSADVCGANPSFAPQTAALCRVTVTDTETVTDSQPTVEISECAPALLRHVAGWIVNGDPVAPTDEELSEAAAALGRKPEAADGMLGWHVASEPIRSVGLALSWANVLMGQAPPDARKPPRYVGESQGCRQAVDRKGWKRAAEIYEWAVRKGKTTSWTTLNDQIDAYETQMNKGTEWVERKPSPTVVSSARRGGETLEEKNARIKKATLDQMLAKGEITQQEYASAA